MDTAAMLIFRLGLAARRYGLPEHFGSAVMFFIYELPFLCSYKEKAQDLGRTWAWSDQPPK